MAVQIVSGCRRPWRVEALRSVAGQWFFVRSIRAAPNVFQSSNKGIAMKSEHQRRIDEFMRNAGQDVPDLPATPSEEVRRLRASLIIEEALETIEALGFECWVAPELDGQRDISLMPIREPRIVDIADGCCDTIVVTLGTLSACGLHDLPLMAEVLDSNDSKFIDGHRREDGKWVKGPSYRPAKIAQVIEEQFLL